MFSLMCFIAGGAVDCMAGVFAGCLLAGARRNNDCRTRTKYVVIEPKKRNAPPADWIGEAKRRAASFPVARAEEGAYTTGIWPDYEPTQPPEEGSEP